MATAHPYGPHRPDDGPATVTVLGPGKWPDRKGHQVAIPKVILNQRGAINTRAHDAARAAQ